MNPTPAKPSHRGLSKQAILCIGLVSFALVSIFSYNRTIEFTIAESSSVQDKGTNATIAASSSIKDKRNNETSATGGGDSHSDNMDGFYNTTWPPLRKALCGEGAPNLMLSTTLFQLARGEVFPQESVFLEMGKNSSDRPSETMTKFFTGEFGGSVFQGYNHDGKRFATLYVRIWKCGNNQIRWMEQKAYKHLNGTYTLIDVWKYLRDYLPEQQQNNMPAPCIYTAIRDPISHFLSGYNEVEVRQLGEYNNQSAKDWPTNSKPAPYHYLVPYSSDYPKVRKMRFRAFVEDLLLEEPTFAKHYVYSHFFSMSRVLVTLAKYKAQLTGYISGLENITTVWPDFMAETCPDFPSRDQIPTMGIQGQHRSSKDRLGLYQAAKEVWEEAGPTSRALCLLHTFDYACFEQLPDGIPAICRAVYREHADAIVSFGTEHYLNYSR